MIAQHHSNISQQFNGSEFTLGAFEETQSPRRAGRAVPLPFRHHRKPSSTSTGSPSLREFPIDNNAARRPGLAVGSPISRRLGGQYQDPAEHMLRRKTPNGTLAAGYDGTPVQFSGKAPVLKQVVLPVPGASSFQNNTGLTMSAGEQWIHHRLNTATWAPEPGNHMTATNAVEGNMSLVNTDPGHWSHHPSLSNVPNHILNHVPLHRIGAQATYNGLQIPMVLQPAYQPDPYYPTASNDGGFYGPYWPDGRFVPYRPAAFRDQGHTAVQKMEVGREAQSADRLPPIRQASFKEYSMLPPSQSKLRNEPTPLAIRNGRTPMTYPSRANNPHFKERTLSWAHSIYVDLLTFLHLSKKENRQGRSSHGSRPHSTTNIYPKPPRQPGSHLGSSRWPVVHHSLESPEKRRHGEMAKHTFSGTPSSKHATWQEPTAAGQDRQPRSEGQDGPHYISPFQSSHGVTHSPLHKAMEALEMLSTLCEQSGWSWIDGMLLGGCLAYGLEDYHKALEWYSKIIAYDSM